MEVPYAPKQRILKMDLIAISKDYIDFMLVDQSGAGRKALLLDKQTLSKLTIYLFSICVYAL